MSDTEHPTPAFLDQITAGMVIDPDPRPSGMDAILGPPAPPRLVTVTGIRVERPEADPVADYFSAIFTRTRGPRTTLHLIGQYADGAPFHTSRSAHHVVHVHGGPAVPDTAEGAGR